MALFSNLNPALETDGPETLLTMAAYMPLSKKPKYNTTLGGTIVKFIPVVSLVKAIFSHKTYTSGQYVLGERFLDHVQGLNTGRQDVTDDVYVAACVFFTIAFGVRITTSEDLDSLDKGSDEYYKRPEKDDIPRDAVARASALKKTYFPISSYNQGPWDLTKFQDYPLLAPIPGITYKTLMDGEVPGVGPIVKGIPMNPSAAMGGQTAPASSGGPTASTSSLTPPIPLAAQPGSASTATPWKIYALIGAGVLVLAVGGYFVFKK